MSDFLEHLHHVILLGAVAKLSIVGVKVALVGTVAGVGAAAKLHAMLKEKRSQSSADADGTSTG